jgi:hypothetical protein
MNSQAKGKRGEMEVVKIINKTLETNVRRTHNSGVLYFKGDITDISPDSIIFDYHFEIKNTKSLQLPKWWRQTTDDCPGTKQPILIFKHNHKWMVATYLEDWLYLLSEIKALRKKKND